jgi:hypothetical protein
MRQRGREEHSETVAQRMSPLHGRNGLTRHESVTQARITDYHRGLPAPVIIGRRVRGANSMVSGHVRLHRCPKPREHTRHSPSLRRRRGRRPIQTLPCPIEGVKQPMGGFGGSGFRTQVRQLIAHDPTMRFNFVERNRRKAWVMAEDQGADVEKEVKVLVFKHFLRVQ